MDKEKTNNSSSVQDEKIFETEINGFKVEVCVNDESISLSDMIKMHLRSLYV